ncbi:hypothetical protein SAMN03159338_2194 [Sphingomonas sp. NFR04]|uniref:hypothetical protein n=1 Tax=Sphingomonas sp. NFR04 TaxID=1566283 RepID=UPI0008E28BF2|nr:hypothetical protein [Sphingomonas sp. NFR04]SFJ69106.1 hypothetical protein SAMN03159338_2194 [Sphingomonas sp. NFR04]
MDRSAAPELSQTEWAAVSVAFRDAAACGCSAVAATEKPSLFGRVADTLFGTRRPTPLANPRLEAIRQFVCTTRRQRQPAAHLVPVLADHGFNPAQIEAIALLAI